MTESESPKIQNATCSALDCCVCLGPSGDESNLLLPPCGHSICASCMTQIQTMNCPLCRAEYTQSDNFDISIVLAARTAVHCAKEHEKQRTRQSAHEIVNRYYILLRNHAVKGFGALRRRDVVSEGWMEDNEIVDLKTERWIAALISALGGNLKTFCIVASSFVEAVSDSGADSVIVDGLEDSRTFLFDLQENGIQNEVLTPNSPNPIANLSSNVEETQQNRETPTTNNPTVVFREILNFEDDSEEYSSLDIDGDEEDEGNTDQFQGDAIRHLQALCSVLCPHKLESICPPSIFREVKNMNLPSFEQQKVFKRAIMRCDSLLAPNENITLVVLGYARLLMVISWFMWGRATCCGVLARWQVQNFSCDEQFSHQRSSSNPQICLGPNIDASFQKFVLQEIAWRCVKFTAQSFAGLPRHYFNKYSPGPIPFLQKV